MPLKTSIKKSTLMVIQIFGNDWTISYAVGGRPIHGSIGDWGPPKRAPRRAPRIARPRHRESHLPRAISTNRSAVASKATQKGRHGIAGRSGGLAGKGGNSGKKKNKKKGGDNLPRYSFGRRAGRAPQGCTGNGKRQKRRGCTWPRRSFQVAESEGGGGRRMEAGRGGRGGRLPNEPSLISPLFSESLEGSSRTMGTRS